MPLLYYWRRDNYRKDLDFGAGHHLNQNNPVMHEVARGDSLWAFTRTADGRYVLAAELIVQAKTMNRPNFRYGDYRVWGDVDRSRYFRVEGTPSVGQIIRSLSIRTEAKVLGQSFQGHAAVREITEADHQVLRDAARTLPLEPRARILPEEKLEAALIMGDRASVERLVRDEEPGVAEERKRYLYENAPQRNPDLVDRLQRLYDGHCQICRWDPVDEYGESLCEGHHIRWLSRGGDDALDNLMLVCPNHHRAIHRCDARSTRATWLRLRRPPRGRGDGSALEDALADRRPRCSSGPFDSQRNGRGSSPTQFGLKADSQLHGHERHGSVQPWPGPQVDAGPDGRWVGGPCAIFVAQRAIGLVRGGQRRPTGGPEHHARPPENQCTNQLPVLRVASDRGPERRGSPTQDKLSQDSHDVPPRLVPRDVGVKDRTCRRAPGEEEEGHAFRTLFVVRVRPPLVRVGGGGDENASQQSAQRRPNRAPSQDPPEPNAAVV
jgi:Predicted restriction endonuclease